MDNKDFIKKLDETTNDILKLAENCSREQLNYKQGVGWNILEIIEHLYLTDNVIYTVISRPSETIHSSSEIIGKETMQKILIEKRSRKITTPDVLQPKGEIKDLTTLVDIFISQRETWKRDLSTGKISIDNRVHMHPIMGKMTIVDWLNFTVHHTQRHIEQVKDIIKN